MFGSFAITFCILSVQEVTHQVIWSLASCNSSTVVHASCTSMLSC